MFYFRDLMNLLYSRTFSECFVDQEITLAGRSDQLFQQVFLRARIKILRMTQTVIAILQASDCLLECFFEILTDTHNLADCTHLCAKLVLYTFELLKRPACKLDYHIVAVRNVFVQSAVFATFNILQCQSACKHRRYKRDRESGCLGCQRRRTGCTRIDLNNDNSV